MAIALGVSSDALSSARRLWLSGHQGQSIRGYGFVAFDLDVPEDLALHVSNRAEQLSASHAEAMRGLLHVVMQRPREPTPRPARVPASQPGFTSYYDPSSPDGVFVIYKTRRRHFRTTLSRELDWVLKERAGALGLTTTRYVVLWLFDWVTGRLDELPIGPLSRDELVAQGAKYLLPGGPP